MHASRWLLSAALMLVVAASPRTTASPGDEIYFYLSPSNGQDTATVYLAGQVDDQRCVTDSVTVTFHYSDYAGGARTAATPIEVHYGSYSKNARVPHDARLGAATYDATADCTGPTAHTIHSDPVTSQ